MTDRRTVLRWLGIALIMAGGALVIVGLTRWVGPAAPLSTTLASATPTSTPEPIVPTRTPTAEATLSPSDTPRPATLTPRPSPTPRPSHTPLPATSTPSPSPTPRPSHTPGPSPTPRPSNTPGPTPTLRPSATPRPATPTSSPAPEGGGEPEGETPTLTPTLIPTSPTTTPTTAASPPSGGFVVPPGERFRLGVSLPYGAGRSYNLAPLRVGWVMDWTARASTALDPGIMYAQTARMKGGALRPEASVLESVARSRPGSLWLISNEADVRWQDNVPPEVYARLYHEAYQAIKRGDPSAVVAAGGIAQPTELRLRYLDLVLQQYQTQFGGPLPAQAWHIHNYMLNEERDSWGVDIPPGLPDDRGARYSVADSGNVERFKAQIYAFRRWMASRGYGGQPLVISEFGIPMPADYGFPPETVASFLEETTRFMLTATDGALGNPGDGGRLVQRWCWFSLAWPDYPTGDLLIMETGAWTELAGAWMRLVGD